MVTLELPVKVSETNQDTERLTIKAATELADLAKKPQTDFPAGRAAEAARWSYRIPFPGVRYYDYDEE
jgi:hypothetical protein